MSHLPEDPQQPAPGWSLPVIQWRCDDCGRDHEQPVSPPLLELVCDCGARWVRGPGIERGELERAEKS